MDDADRAGRQIENAVDDALAEARRGLRAGPEPRGACLYCDEPLGPGRLFCDADCRDGYEHETRLRRMQGVK